MSELEKVNKKVKGGNIQDVFEGHNPEVKVRTKKMLMYLIIFAIVMIFAGLTSAYIVVNANKFWVHVNAPSWLIASCIIIAISSASIYGAYLSAKKGKHLITTALIVLTLFLGLLFTYSQYKGWEQLSEKGMGYKMTLVDGVKVSSWNRLSEIKGEYGTDYYVHKNGEKLIYENGEYYMPDDQFRAEPLTPSVNKTSNLNGSFIAVLIFVHIVHLMFGLIYLIVLTFRSVTKRIDSSNTISLYTGGMYWHFLGILWIYLFLFLFFIH